MHAVPIKDRNLLIFKYLISIIASRVRTNIYAVRESFRNIIFIKYNTDIIYNKKLPLFLAKTKLINDKKEKIIPCIK